MKKIVTIAFILLLAGCSSTSKEETTKDAEASKKLELAEIGSAFPKDKEKRIQYLKTEIKERSQKLKNVESALLDGKDLEENQLTSEVLINELLLLEAERFGLEEGLDIPESDL